MVNTESFENRLLMTSVNGGAILIAQPDKMKTKNLAKESLYKTNHPTHYLEFFFQIFGKKNY
jgi:hypothetical protein